MSSDKGHVGSTQVNQNNTNTRRHTHLGHCDLSDVPLELQTQRHDGTQAHKVQMETNKSTWPYIQAKDHVDEYPGET